VIQSDPLFRIDFINHHLYFVSWLFKSSFKRMPIDYDHGIFYPYREIQAIISITSSYFVPILCFAKKLYKWKQNRELQNKIWISLLYVFYACIKLATGQTSIIYDYKMCRFHRFLSHSNGSPVYANFLLLINYYSHHQVTKKKHASWAWSSQSQVLHEHFSLFYWRFQSCLCQALLDIKDRTNWCTHIFLFCYCTKE